MSKWLSKYFSVLKVTWIQTLEYKANAVVGLFAILSGILIEFMIWDRVFSASGKDTINGFSFMGLMSFIFISLIVGQLKSSWVTSFEMIDLIRTGGLNKYLIRPISFYTYHIMIFIGVNSLFFIVYFFLLLIFPFIMPGYLFQEIIQIVLFIPALAASIFISYSIYFFLVCLAFWFSEVKSIVLSYNLVNIFLAGQIIPLSFFPDKVRYFISLTPLSLLVDFPVRIATGMIESEGIKYGFMMVAIWSAILMIINKVIYSIGIRRYEGYGA